MVSLTEENYIKSLYMLSLQTGEVSVSELAKKLAVKLPTVNSMIKKLALKKVVTYAPYQGIRVTEKGKKEALLIIRKHRLAELFLVKIMGFGWEEVHDVAEQLEHVQSTLFYERMDEMLGYPKFDPHGEPIPDSNGRVISHKGQPINEVKSKSVVKIVAVANDDKSFLAHLNTKGIQIGDTVTVKAVEDFDGSVVLVDRSKKEFLLSHQVAERLYVEIQ